jgi:hypothetical protein
MQGRKQVPTKDGNLQGQKSEVGKKVHNGKLLSSQGEHPPKAQAQI